MAFEKEWKNLKNRRNIFWAVVIAFPFVGYFALKLINHTGSQLGGLTFFLIWMLAFAISGFRYNYWICPRCKEYFFSKFGITHTFISKCTSCGLNKWS